VQIILRVKWTPEQYVAEQCQHRMKRPDFCPHCQQRALRALGYYKRWLSGLTQEPLRISVRRFKCKLCRLTVSLLPWFAQPYRVVRNKTIEAYFFGISDREDVQRWSDPLGCYWRRFTRWLPELREAVGAAFGRAPPTHDHRRWATFVVGITGDFAGGTQRLVTERRVTAFGRYRCHSPNPRASTHLIDSERDKSVKPYAA